MKKQIVAIHGGDTFKTYREYLADLKNSRIDFERLKSKKKRWKENLSDRLGKNFEVILPRMPNASNARYSEWKIAFKKLIPFLEDGLILIGHSLGGIFLAKYLSENKFPKKILATILVSAPFDDKGSSNSLCDFRLPRNLEKFKKQGGKIILFHSKDDLVVPLADLEGYKKAMPEAEAVVFKNRGHFDQVEFPELIVRIKNLKKNG